MTRDWLIVLASLLALPLDAVSAQQPSQPSRDSLRLGSLHQEAVAHDPRQSQFGLLDRQTDLRLTNLTAERLPAISFEAQGLYQSPVFAAPPGVPFPAPSKDIRDIRVSVDQAIFDQTINRRRATERARLAESAAQVRTTLFGLRQEVNDAFFTAALIEKRIGILEATITGLERQHQEAVERVRAGAALPGDTAALEASLVEHRQDVVVLASSRRAALERLAQLTGRAALEADVMALPDLANEVAQARGELAGLRSRPEYEEYARTRERLAREDEEVAAAQWPQLSAFARIGRGRPGLNPINTGWANYTIAGLKLTWSPWTWGSNGRERQALTLQRDIVAADEAAFEKNLTRSLQQDLATIDRMDTTLAMDDHIIALRERVENETRRRFEEGVVTASEYVDRSNDVLEARLSQATHRVELALARARLLTNLGLEIP